MRKIEGEEAKRRRVSQQRRGAKRQSGFMIFSQHHFSRYTHAAPKNDERRKDALMSRVFYAPCA